MSEGDNSNIRERIGAYLRDARKERKQSLRGVQDRVYRKFQMKLAPSSLLHLEENGASLQAARLLVLLRYYEITLGSVVDDSKPATSLAEFKVKELLDDQHFLHLCEELYRLRPKSRRGMIRGLCKFLLTLRKTAQK